MRSMHVIKITSGGPQVLELYAQATGGS